MRKSNYCGIPIPSSPLTTTLDNNNNNKSNIRSYKNTFSARYHRMVGRPELRRVGVLEHVLCLLYQVGLACVCMRRVGWKTRVVLNILVRELWFIFMFKSMGWVEDSFNFVSLAIFIRYMYVIRVAERRVIYKNMKNYAFNWCQSLKNCCSFLSLTGTRMGRVLDQKAK